MRSTRDFAPIRPIAGCPSASVSPSAAPLASTLAAIPTLPRSLLGSSRGPTKQQRPLYKCRWRSSSASSRGRALGRRKCTAVGDGCCFSFCLSFCCSCVVFHILANNEKENMTNFPGLPASASASASSRDRPSSAVPENFNRLLRGGCGESCARLCLRDGYALALASLLKQQKLAGIDQWCRRLRLQQL